MKLNLFLNDGISTMVNTVKHFYLGNSRGTKFVLRQVKATATAARRRDAIEREQGVHVPAFLIASIASQCNLFCSGCYARANGGLDSNEHLSDQDWSRIFDQAQEIGISFILLAGGEPMTRFGVIEAAAAHRDIIFPLFTNGTMFDENALGFLEENPNIVPILSIEGDAARTDSRRGAGVAAKVEAAQAELAKRKILWGASVTVTTENIDEVTDPSYVASLRERGCGAIVFVEYAPVEAGTDHLALDDDGQVKLCMRTEELSAMRENKGTVLVAFPGSEEKMGGCLAAGRGFFHINQLGGAEPCPFSPFSSVNVAEHGLLEALKSPFFEKVRELEAADMLVNGHMGGCTLLRHEDEVKELLSSQETQLESASEYDARKIAERLEANLTV